jgi:hypothetical protein
MTGRGWWCGEGSDTATAVQASLHYDPLGRSLEVAGGGSTARFLYDGDELLVEYNTVGAMLRRYFHGPGALTKVRRRTPTLGAAPPLLTRHLSYTPRNSYTKRVLTHRFRR